MLSQKTRSAFSFKRPRLQRLALLCVAAAAVALALAASVPAPSQSETRTLRFGINPWGDEKEMRAIFRPLMDYLGERLGVNFEIVIPSNYDDLLRRTSTGELHLVSINAVTYLKALRQGMNINYLGTTLRKDEGDVKPRDSYIGFIIVRKDSKYHKLEDLRGKTFAFVDQSSGSGYKMPLAILARDYHTTPDKFFRKYFFVGDHDQVASAVYNRCVDGGATWDNSYKLNSQKKKFGPSFRVIKRTPAIPNDAWAAGPGVDPELAERMRKLLIGINTKTRTRGGKFVIDLEAGFPGTGWRYRGPEFYEAAARYLLYEPK